ncbi:LexA family transcriptional regulator [Sinorhizobium medicae WSM1115]|uniref:LexA family transcriptional regulator n=1 Tax=Sinorhizobium medicae TaxID=110321 RepID=UPI00036AFF50|nr:XRE family transcriptional regulator [Sinorhizobium medicae]RVI52137.1 LexA family transcriptional regulator [Sinorhizobium medicae]UFX03464.1 LexA family transcriptional regulator [Sinorhizobium medicae WSM1115]
MTKPLDSVTEKFRQLRERAGLSMDELAKGMGYKGASSIQRYENPDEYKKEFISPDIAAKLLNVVVGKGTPPIDAKEVWGLTRPASGALVGSFDPDTHEQFLDDGAPGYTREHWRAHVEGALPELDVKLGAGEGIVGDTINIPVGNESATGHRVVAEWLIPVDYLRSEAKVSINHTVVMEIVGDSMQPDFLPGDRVIVDLSQNQCLHDGEYAFSDGISPPQIKRFQRIHFTDPPEVKIVSINPGYDSFRVELHRVHILGRVCGHVTRK